MLARIGEQINGIFFTQLHYKIEVNKIHSISVSIEVFPTGILWQHCPSLSYHRTVSVVLFCVLTNKLTFRNCLIIFIELCKILWINRFSKKENWCPTIHLRLKNSPGIFTSNIFTFTKELASAIPYIIEIGPPSLYY